MVLFLNLLSNICHPWEAYSMRMHRHPLRIPCLHLGTFSPRTGQESPKDPASITLVQSWTKCLFLIVLGAVNPNDMYRCWILSDCWNVPARFNAQNWRHYIPEDHPRLLDTSSCLIKTKVDRETVLDILNYSSYLPFHKDSDRGSHPQCHGAHSSPTTLLFVRHG